VGQGDAAYIRIKNKFDVLIDSGPNQSILSCLGKYIPFYDHSIELALLSHPHKDHYGGFEGLLDHYQIKNFITSPVDNPASSFQQLKKKLKEKNVNFRYAKANNTIKIPPATLTFYWPEKELLNFKNNLDLNQFSLVFLFQENGFRVLFPGDTGYDILNRLSLKADIIKIPHHGSKNNLNSNFFRLAKFDTAIISVGKNNSFGHPAKQTLDLLKKYEIKMRRTDEEGNITFRLK